MYDERQAKNVGVRFNKYLFAVWLLLLLSAVRFVNLGINWFAIRGEIDSNQSLKTTNYTYLHLGSLAGADDALSRYSRTKTNVTRAAAWFDLLCPAHFLVHNKTSGLTPVDLGPVIVLAPPGKTQYSLNFWDGISAKPFTQAANTSGSRAAESALYRPSILGSLIFPAKKKQRISFTVKPPGSSLQSMLPWLLYFFLPLVVILGYGYQRSRAVWIAFFYYPFAFLLFDYQLLFFHAPLYPLLKTLKSDFVLSLAPVIAPVIALLLTIPGIVGIMKRREMKDNFAETLVVFFFLCLPLILRI